MKNDDDKDLPTNQVCHGGMNLYVTVFENS